MRNTIIISFCISLLIVGVFEWSQWSSTPQKVVEKPSVVTKIEAPLPVTSVSKKEFNPNEIMALRTAEVLVETGDISGYHQLRDLWKDHEKQLAKWCFLDSEACLEDGRLGMASETLSAYTFSKEEETERLVRLASLHMFDNPQKALGILTEAIIKDPSNPDLHTYRATLLEASSDFGKADDEYIAAIRKDPANPHLREQLADFYLRLKKYPEALLILRDALSAPSTDSIALKLLFWNRLISTPNSWALSYQSNGKLAPLIAYLNSLPEGVYWEAIAFKRLKEKEYYLANFQELFWLQLLDNLKKDKIDEALKLLRENRFTFESWDESLESQLMTLLQYRSSPQKMIVADPTGIFSASSKEKYLEALECLRDNIKNHEDLSVSNEFHQILTQPNAVSLLLMAHGWREAALQLYSSARTNDSTLPAWAAVEFTHTFYDYRTPDAALEFAMSQPSTPQLALLIAQIALKLEKPQMAQSALIPVYKNRDENGPVAAFMLANIFFSQENYKAAKDAIEAQPELANRIAVRELVARIAAKEGDFLKAESLYSSIEKKSHEAKSYLVQRAFEERDWKRARELTEALIVDFPNNPVLLENLKKIAKEESKK